MNVYFTNTFYTSQTENDLSEYTVIDVTSRVTRNKEFMAQHPRFARELSPFYLGPVTSSDGTVAEIFEIFSEIFHAVFDKQAVVTSDGFGINAGS